MRNVVIIAIRESVINNQTLQDKLQAHTYGKYGEYRVYKVISKNGSIISSKIDNNMLLVADVAFDTSTKNLIKNRYGSNIMAFPKELRKLYTPVVFIAERTPSYADMEKQFLRKDIVWAVYLTDTFERYKDNIDSLEYQTVRYQNGKEIPKDIMINIIEKFPEKLI